MPRSRSWLSPFCSHADARRASKKFSVGIVCNAESIATTVEGFTRAMTELGYLEGNNIIYDIRKVNSNLAAVNDILERFVSRKVDLIFAFPVEAAKAAKEATAKSGIPVVFAWSSIE